MLERLKRILSSRTVEWTGAGKTIRLPAATGGNRSFALRDTFADTTTVRQIFRDGQYDTAYFRRAAEIARVYDAICARGRTPLILDAGSNIGASAVYFSQAYRKSHIVCFEPAPDNFTLLRQNTEGLDVELHEAGIGIADTLATLVDPGEGAWGYRTSLALDPPGAAGPVAIEAIAKVVARKIAEGFVPFIAKIDIEGAEAELFDPPNDWADAFPLLVVELHDYLLPQKRVSRGFLSYCASRDRDFVYKGETIFSIANAMDAAAATSS